MNPPTSNNINFLFLHNYYYQAPCLFFEEIEKIVNTHTKDDINNGVFDWGFNCDMDRTPVRNRDIFPYLSKNIDNLANQIGAKLKVQLNEPWINSYKKGQYQETHDHDGHVFSSVIFLNEGVNFAEFYFVDRMIDPTPHSLKKLLKMEDLWYPEVNKGDIVIFPAHMLHGVSPHKSDVVRKTLSFNIDVLEVESNE